MIEKYSNKLHRYLIIHSFYPITEFIERKIDKDDISGKKLLLWLATLVVNAFILIMCWIYY
jgi:hypothetical protein